MPIPELPNPFNDVSDETLYQMQIALTYACLRSRVALKKEHKTYVCNLQRILNQQATDRPSKKPDFPSPPPA